MKLANERRLPPSYVGTIQHVKRVAVQCCPQLGVMVNAHTAARTRIVDMTKPRKAIAGMRVAHDMH